MSRKKSRKVGLIGVRSVPKEQRQTVVSPSKPKKKVGNPSGSRHSVKVENESGQKTQNRDPRFGSKKPIPLVVEEKTTNQKPKQKYFSPKQELEAIENDQQLSRLLDQLDSGKSLSPEQQKYVDEKLSRHKALCELLGIVEEDETEQEEEVEQDPQARFDSIDPNKLG